jgi:hypothetical protein
MRWVPGWLLFGILSSCDCTREGLTATHSALQLSSDPFDFARTAIGAPRDLDGTLSNLGRSTVRAELTTEPPFEVSPAVLVLESGATVPFRITFNPTREGAAEGTLFVRSPEATLEATSSGEGVRPASCLPSGSCREAVFDEQTATCVEHVLADETPCSSACLNESRCRSGTCVGTAVTCDDADRCTADSCSRESGCKHAPVRCAAPENPCQVAFCDPTSGCSVTDAPDGTRCGSADCLTARVCLAGQCKAASVPEGSRCGVTTLCQAEGICRNQRCQQPPPAPLTPAWSYQAAAGTRIDWSGLADLAGNLFWTECAPSGCELVSVTRDGAVRYRSALGDAATYSADYGAIVLADGKVVFASLGGDLVRAFDAATGVQQWERHLAPDLSPTYLSTGRCAALPPNELELNPLLSDGRGHLALIVHVANRQSCTTQNLIDVWMVSLDAATGATRWVREFTSVHPSAGYSSYSMVVSAVFDDAGNLFTKLQYPTTWDSTVVSLDDSGTLRWSRLLPSGSNWLGGVYQQLLFVPGYQTPYLLLDTANGQTRAALPIEHPFLSPLIDSQQGVVLSAPVTGPVLDLNRIDLMSTLTAPKVNLVTLPPSSVLFRGTQPILTSRGSILLATGPDYTATGGSYTLSEFAMDGAPGLRCPIPGLFDLANQPALRRGRWTVAEPDYHSTLVRSFDLPGYEPAAAGWVTQRGKMSREGSPR